MLSAHALSASLGGRSILSGVDLSLSPGTLAGLVGPNGAGKSTLLRALAGLGPGAAAVSWLDTPVTQLTPRQRARAIGYLPQSQSVDFPFTVADAVAMGRYAHGDEGAPSGRDAVRRALVAQELLELSDRRITTLSGGERQRVAVARLMATEAPVWLLDEPTNSLDLRHAFALLEACQRHVEGGGLVVVALHDLALCDRFATRVAVLADSRLEIVAPPELAFTPERLARVFGVAATRHEHGLSLSPL